MVLNNKEFQAQVENEFSLLKCRSDNFTEMTELTKFIEDYDIYELESLFIKNLFVDSIIKADTVGNPDLDNIVFGLLSNTKYDFNKYDKFDDAVEFVSMSGTASLREFRRRYTEKGNAPYGYYNISIIPECLVKPFNADVLIPIYKKLCDRVFHEYITKKDIKTIIAIGGKYDIEVMGTLEYDPVNTSIYYEFNAQPCAETVIDIDTAVIDKMTINEHLKNFLKLFTRKYFVRVGATDILNNLEDWLKKCDEEDCEKSFVKGVVYALVETIIYNMGPKTLANYMYNATVREEDCVYVSDILYDIGESIEGMSTYRMAPLIKAYNNKLVNAAKKVAAEMKNRSQFSKVITIHGLEMLVTGSYICTVDRKDYYISTQPMISFKFKIRPTDKALKDDTKSVETENGEG